MYNGGKLIHDEFVIQFQDGSRDWVDPVYTVTVTETEIRVSNGIHTYTYNRVDVVDWTVRPYSKETTFDPI